jgi:hypothetical protein
LWLVVVSRNGREMRTASCRAASQVLRSRDGWYSDAAEKLLDGHDPLPICSIQFSLECRLFLIRHHFFSMCKGLCGDEGLRHGTSRGRCKTPRNPWPCSDRSTNNPVGQQKSTCCLTNWPPLAMGPAYSSSYVILHCLVNGLPH